MNLPHIIDQADEPAALRGEVRHYQCIARQAVRQSTYRSVIEALRRWNGPVLVSLACLIAVYFIAKVVGL